MSSELKRFNTDERIGRWVDWGRRNEVFKAVGKFLRANRFFASDYRLDNKIDSSRVGPETIIDRGKTPG
jgi:hypothetical protein